MLPFAQSKSISRLHKIVNNSLAIDSETFVVMEYLDAVLQDKIVDVLVEDLLNLAEKK